MLDGECPSEGEARERRVRAPVPRIRGARRCGISLLDGLEEIAQVDSARQAAVLLERRDAHVVAA